MNQECPKEWFATNGTQIRKDVCVKTLMHGCSLCGLKIEHGEEFIIEEARYEKIHQYHPLCWERLKDWLFNIRKGTEK